MLETQLVRDRNRIADALLTAAAWSRTRGASSPETREKIAMRILYQLTSPMHKTVGPQGGAPAIACCRPRRSGTEVTASRRRGPGGHRSAHDAGSSCRTDRLAPLAQKPGSMP